MRIRVLRIKARPLDSRPSVHQERNDCADQEDNEQDLCDARSSGSDAAKAKDGRNQGDYQKDDGIVQHVIPLIVWLENLTPLNALHDTYGDR
jgi:hypothetical protein